MVSIYILQLQNNKYYVGKTLNHQFRLEQHFTNHGSEWTKKHKPIKILKIEHNCDVFDEDKYTLKAMTQFGINNVRGGSYTKIKLDNYDIENIKKMIDTATDNCYICGVKGHFAKDCQYDEYNIKDVHKLLEKLTKENKCFRCHRIGHRMKKCYAKTLTTGEHIDFSSDDEKELWSCNYCGKDFETYKGAKYHETKYCKKSKNN
jgi:hypothetical protein